MSLKTISIIVMKYHQTQIQAKKKEEWFLLYEENGLDFQSQYEFLFLRECHTSIFYCHVNIKLFFKKKIIKMNHNESQIFSSNFNKMFDFQ